MAISFVFDTERAPLVELPAGASAVGCPRCGGAMQSNSVVNFGLVEVDGEVRAVPILVQPSWHFECDQGHVISTLGPWWEAVSAAADELSDGWSVEVDPAMAGVRPLRVLPEGPGIDLPDDVA